MLEFIRIKYYLIQPMEGVFMQQFKALLNKLQPKRMFFGFSLYVL